MAASRRLLLITTEFPPQTGGVARYLETLKEYFGKRIRVVSDPTQLLRSHGPLRWLTAVRLLIKERATYDLVITSHVLPFGTAAWVASWFTRKPYLVVVHGMDVRLALQHPLKQWVASRVLKRAALVITNSNALNAEVALQFRLSRLLTIYPCVNPQRTSPSVSSNDKPLTLLTVGRLVARKGHLQVLMALQSLKTTGRIPPFRYVIVGKGPERTMLEQTAGELNLHEVEFLGEVDENTLRDCYAQADLFVMPVSNDPIDKEGFGLVFLEAAQFGIPSISTTISGVDEAIVHGQTGLLVAPGNLQALSQAIFQLSTDISLRQQLGQNAKTRVQNMFACVDQWKKLDPYL
ncbi:glycosyltransferase family 4 protein [Candidatus Uhrbacteria bacterium]|nr:glycosyltransferase family 4 protein [Candidatus Uhrbacteria bacterium]